MYFIVLRTTANLVNVTNIISMTKLHSSITFVKEQKKNKIHFTLMQVLLILYLNKVKPPKTHKKVSSNQFFLTNDSICNIVFDER